MNLKYFSKKIFIFLLTKLTLNVIIELRQTGTLVKKFTIKIFKKTLDKATIVCYNRIGAIKNFLYFLSLSL